MPPKTDSVQTIMNKINTAVRKKVNAKLIPRMAAVSKRINDRIAALVKTAIFNSAEVQAIIRGQEGITGELGLDPTSDNLRGRFERITEEWSKTIKTTFVPLRKGDLITSKANIRVVGLSLDYAELLSLQEATFVTPNNGFTLPWLQWLLTEGDAVITDVEPFGFKESDQGHTGLGIMVQGGGNKFKIPVDFSGTIKDNILTRAVDQIRAEDIKKIVVQEFKRAIG